MALTQVLLQYALIVPVFALVGESPSLSHLQFLGLVLASLFIAAAGYIINDYFDIKADEINKPHKIYINRGINRRTAMVIHLLLNGLGIGLGFLLAYQVGAPKLGFIQVAAVCLLWYYSVYFKKMFWVGNFVIAFLSALIVLSVAAFEPKIFDGTIFPFNLRDNLLVQYFLGYAGFAFWLTLIRELVKDMEDISGDLQLNARTIPIVLGIPVSKAIAWFMLVLFGAALVLYQINAYSVGQVQSISLIVAFLEIPLLYILYLLPYADKSSDFKYISLLIKLLMLMGILYLLFLRSTLTYNEPTIEIPQGFEIEGIEMIDGTQTL